MGTGREARVLLPVCSGVAMELEQARRAPNPFMGTPRSVTPSAHPPSPSGCWAQHPLAFVRAGKLPALPLPAALGSGPVFQIAQSQFCSRKTSPEGGKKQPKQLYFCKHGCHVHDSRSHGTSRVPRQGLVLPQCWARMIDPRLQLLLKKKKKEFFQRGAISPHCCP